MIFLFDKATRVALVLPKNTRGDTSERIYGLNKPELVKHRSKVVRKLVAFALCYHKLQEARDALDEAISDDEEYSAFARMVKAKFVQQPA